MPIGRNPTLSALSFQANAGEGRKNKKSSAKSVFLKRWRGNQVFKESSVMMENGLLIMQDIFQNSMESHVIL